MGPTEIKSVSGMVSFVVGLSKGMLVAGWASATPTQSVARRMDTDSRISLEVFILVTHKCSWWDNKLLFRTFVDKCTLL